MGRGSGEERRGEGALEGGGGEGQRWARARREGGQGAEEAGAAGSRRRRRWRGSWAPVSCTGLRCGRVKEGLFRTHGVCNLPPQSSTRDAERGPLQPASMRPIAPAPSQALASLRGASRALRHASTQHPAPSTRVQGPRHAPPGRRAPLP